MTDSEQQKINIEKKDSKNLQKYISERDKILETSETLYVSNVNLHPQINHIVFKTENNEYNMWDKYGTYFSFTALNYGETREEYVRKRTLK